MMSAVALIASSCSDFLNMPPKNVKVVYTIEDVREAMSIYLFAITSSSAGQTISKYIMFNGNYVQFPFTRHVNTSAQILSNDLDLSNFLDDQGTVNKSRGGYGLLKDYIGGKYWESYELASRIWRETFVNIGYLNMVMKDLENTPDFDQVTYDRVSGEARVARAYYLLQLNQLFAPATMNDYGIPFNLDADVIEGGARWKQTELYKKLINEILEVMEYKSVPKESWNIFYNRRVMCAILAQTYRYKAHTCAAEASDWANAEKYAKEARNGERMANTKEEVREITRLPEQLVVNKPHPFALIRFSLYASANNDYAPWGNLSEKLFQRPSEELFNLYDDNDFRKEIYFTKHAQGHYNVSRQNYNSSVNDTHVLFSHAELLLIEAEAAAAMNNMVRAKELLNDFKGSRIPGYAGYSGNDVVGEIYNERRKEFAYEGLSNWVDMKIRGEAVTRKAFDEEQDRVATYSLEKNDYRFTLPIPIEETQYNNIPQNPGWR